MNFILSHTVIQLSSHSFTTEMRAGNAFEVHFWHDLFLFEIDGTFGNETVFVGIIVLPLFRCIGGAFLVGIMFIAVII